MKKTIKSLKKSIPNTGPEEINNGKTSRTIKNLSSDKRLYKRMFPDRTRMKPQENKKGPKV